MADVLTKAPLNIKFRRSLVGDKWVRWLHLVQRLMSVCLNEDSDVLVWKLDALGAFTVKSMYTNYMNGHTIFL